MPAPIGNNAHHPSNEIITKFTNCRVLRGDKLVKEDLWISSETGRILNGQELLYGYQSAPDTVIDLGGRIISPGLIDVQLNGAFGFDLSVAPDDMTDYAKGLIAINRGLIKTGITSYSPTLTSQKREVYHKVLPFLGPSRGRRRASDGAESLGAHCEGPFISPLRNGIHTKEILQDMKGGIEDLKSCYGASNLFGDSATVKYITLAPELPGAMAAIRDLKNHGVKVSIGHTTATYEQAQMAMKNGATMITHLFNAMNPLHHRNPGLFGLLGQPSKPDSPKPYFGIIADGIHLHSSAINIAWNAHPDGLILVTDAMSLAGLPDGVYESANSDRIVKSGSLLKLQGSGKIAGSSISLIECVNNFLKWSDASVADALIAATATPAQMLEIAETKGTLTPGADADLVVLDEDLEGGHQRLRVTQVWKFGKQVFDSSEHY